MALIMNTTNTTLRTTMILTCVMGILPTAYLLKLTAAEP
jgi:hypothetical protein